MGPAMKIRHIQNFDKLPGTNARTAGHQLHGGAFRYGFQWSTAYIINLNNRMVARTFYGASSGTVNGQAASASLDFNDLDQAFAEADSDFVFGFRWKFEYAYLATYTSATKLAWVGKDNTFANAVPILGIEHLATKTVGTEHYFEIVVSRKNFQAKIYRDNIFIADIDMSASFQPGDQIKVLQMGHSEVTMQSNTSQKDLRTAYWDFYLAEIEAGDTYNRLGPQRVLPLTADAVEVPNDWTTTSAGTSVTSAINDGHGVSTPSALITETQPGAKIVFTSPGIGQNDVVNAVLVGADARGDAGASDFTIEQFDGEAVVGKKSFQVGQNYDPALPVGQSGMFCGIGVITEPAPVVGDASAITNLSVRIRAGSV